MIFPPLLIVLALTSIAKVSTNPRAPSKYQILALGRSARLGELYDAVSEQFVGFTVFKSTLPASLITTTETPWTKSHFEIANTVSEKRKVLKLSISATISIFFGLIKVTGSAEYMQETRTSSKSVSAFINYQTRTKKDTVNLFYTDTEPYLFDGVKLAQLLRGVRATHVVTSIDYGGDIVVQFEDRNPEKKNTQVIKGSLQVILKPLLGLFGAEGSTSASADEENSKRGKNVVIKLFGDVSSGSQAPQTYDQVIQFIRKVPQLIAQYNDGKGKPVMYTLFPLDILREKLRLDGLDNVTTTAASGGTPSSTTTPPPSPPTTPPPPPQTVIHEIDPATSHSFLKISDDMTQVQQTLDDLDGEVRMNQNCLSRRDDIDDTFEPIRNGFRTANSHCRQQVKQGLLRVRAGDKDNSYLREILGHCLNSSYSPSNTLEKMKTAEFLKFYQKLKTCQILKAAATVGGGGGGEAGILNQGNHRSSVEYLDSTILLPSILLKYLTKNIFILFYSHKLIQLDPDGWIECATIFFKLAKSPLNQMVVIDCQFDELNCGLNDGRSKRIVQKVTLIQYRELTLVSTNVPKDLNLNQNLAPILTRSGCGGGEGPFPKIGQLYDANQEKFLVGQNILKEEVVSDHGDGGMKLSQILIKEDENVKALKFEIDTLNEDHPFRRRLEALKIGEDEALAILMGQVVPQNYGKYLKTFGNYQKFHVSSVHDPLTRSGSLVTRMGTTMTSLSINDPKFPYFIQLHTATGVEGATHFVQEIRYGTTSIIQINRDENFGQKNKMAFLRKKSPQTLITENLYDLKTFLIQTFVTANQEIENDGKKVRPEKKSGHPPPPPFPQLEMEGGGAGGRPKFKIYSDTLKTQPKETRRGEEVKNFIQGMANFSGITEGRRGEPITVVLYPLVNLQQHLGVMKSVPSSKMPLKSVLTTSEVAGLFKIFDQIERMENLIQNFANNFNQHVFHTSAATAGAGGWGTLCLSRKKKREMGEFAKNFRQNISNWVSDTRQRLWGEEQPMKMMTMTSEQVDEEKDEIFKNFYKLNLTMNHIQAKLETEFEWLFRKMRLREKAQIENIGYHQGDRHIETTFLVKDGGEGGDRNYYFLYFDEKSVSTNESEWLENLYHFFNLLNLPHRHRLLFVDCDCGHHHNSHDDPYSAPCRGIKKPAIYEFRSGIKSPEDIVTFLKRKDDTQIHIPLSSSQEEAPAGGTTENGKDGQSLEETVINLESQFESFKLKAKAQFCDTWKNMTAIILSGDNDNDDNNNQATKNVNEDRRILTRPNFCSVNPDQSSARWR